MTSSGPGGRGGEDAEITKTSNKVDSCCISDAPSTFKKFGCRSDALERKETLLAEDHKTERGSITDKKKVKGRDPVLYPSVGAVLISVTKQVQPTCDIL